VDSTFNPGLHLIADDIPLVGFSQSGETVLEVSGWGAWIDD